MHYLIILFWLLVSSALAGDASLMVSPAANLERGLTVVQGQKLEFRVKPGVPDLQTVTLNITRGGRVVGEYAMRREGEDYIATLPLELPGAHILTVRLYQQSRVWASALDMSVLEPSDAKQVPSTARYNEPLQFNVTEGKPGGDTNPIWGLVPLVLLGAGVFFVTRGKKKPKAVNHA
jgi:hypothetical protein